MAHSSPISVPPDTYAKFNRCVHCGLCLPACPTYLETANEADSPRGRIHLMKAVLDGHIDLTAARSTSEGSGASEAAGSGETGAGARGGRGGGEGGVLAHLDACLVCRACEPACPSGVIYHDLIESVRPQIAAVIHGQPLQNPLLTWLIQHILPYPNRLRASLLPLRILHKLGLSGLITRITKRLPAPLPAMVDMLPPPLLDAPLFARSLPAMTRALGERRGSVLLLQGCIGSVLSQSVNRAAITVLAHNGYDVHLLGSGGGGKGGRGGEPCCGAMAAHGNDPVSARAHALRMLEVLTARTEDFFVSPIAGCGAQLKELDQLLGDEAPSLNAAALTAKVRDITEILALHPLRPTLHPIARRVAYHDPCHLLNVQKISTPPRQLLAQIPGLTLIPLPETDLCCGAAGTYNLSQPAMAQQLGQRKVQNILSTGAQIVATANVGCQLQMQRQLAAAGHTDIPVLHVVELLARSCAPPQ